MIWELLQICNKLLEAYNEIIYLTKSDQIDSINQRLDQLDADLMKIQKLLEEKT